MNSSSESSRHPKAIGIFLLATSFYLYEYILQVAPSVMAHEVMQTFGVGAVGLGTISSFYFYAYAPMQLPAGLLFDCYGPRKMITSAILFCAFGAVFFALTNSVIMASMGRFLIGIGSAFSFIGIIVLISRWFPAKQFALMAGVAQMGSSLGAIFGELPLASLSGWIGWRHSMFVLAAIGVFLAMAVWLVIRDEPYQTTTKKKKINLLSERRKILAVVRKPQTWWVGLYAFCSWTPIAIFGALWGVPYLQRLYGVSPSVAAAACMMIWLAIGLGSPLLGWLSDKANKRRVFLMLPMMIGLLASIILLTVGAISWGKMYLLLFVFGLSASGQTLSFSLVKANNRPDHVGSASGFNNLSVLIGGAFFQPAFGYILHLMWDGQMENHFPVYSIHAYKVAMSMIPVFFIVGFFVAAFKLKEPPLKS